MSKSRTPTPTQNLPSTSTNIAPREADDLTTSRPRQRHDTTLEKAASKRKRPSPPTPAIGISSSPPSPRAASKRGVARTPADDPVEPMAKRLRRESVEAQDRRPPRSSPSSDSQGEMADTEPDVQKNESTGASSATIPPPKKKRTRTLTTPHQAAVLHALLAQSRFPTTAMREEVGRSIGLSARKVQIWFQNQRQKARRPRSQGDATANRPPQYGPFPTTSTLPALSSYPLMSGMPTMRPGYNAPGPSTRRDYDEALAGQFHHRASSSTDSIRGESMVEDLPRLLGPGVPGTELYIHRSFHGRGSDYPVSAPPTETYFATGSTFRHGSPGPSASPPLHHPLTNRPATSQPSSWRERDFSRTLPPLVPSRPSTSSSARGRRSLLLGGSSPRRRPTLPPILSRRSRSPEMRFAHQPPDAPVGQSIMGLPRPYALQPAPRWDDSPLPPNPRLSPSWPHLEPRLTGGRSVSPDSSWRSGGSGGATESLRHVNEERTPQHRSPPLGPTPRPSPPASRPGRYDPVREIFVPFPDPRGSAAQPPSQLEDEARSPF